MRICIIAEGSYPYITGGVSSWIHSLTTDLPEFEFVILAIGAEEKQRGQFKYKLPPNVVEVKEIFLDDYLREAGEWGHRYRLTDPQKEALYSLLGGKKDLEWGGLFDLLRSKKLRNAADFLMSKDFFDILVNLCREKYAQIPFTEMFWTVRSMILPLFLSIRHDIPKADLYHSVATGYAGVIGSLAKHLYGKPYVLTEHGIYSREREEEIIKADWVKGYFKDLWIEYFYRLSRCPYDYADQVITLFNRNREIQMELGCKPDKISIVPNGVKVHDYAGIVQNPDVDESKIRLGAIVRVVPIKDIKTMLQSFALVKREVPEAELYIMGPAEEDQEYYEECLLLVESLQIKDVTFTGEVRIKDYLGRMDIVLLSSISEGMPLAVLESMACAKPCVTTDVGSCRELLHGLDDGIGPAGAVVPVMHYDHMASAIIKLCNSRKLREDMGRNGLERVRRHYTHEVFIQRYRQLYSSYKEERTWPVSGSN
ncbi:GT4 family glycosyltransferase PelF [Paenibacillus sp. MZ04-78.2]|uniref:GT4 family glycosyltransferase PelF n=1 Tax=Paenibacillus sp. MZ04-78.2 TaxID=2962034 RepID=UPI0020B72C3B|nr:GT4 family glycosyltransferase PelF [Paenibacillus sp. MZ04-78.2]MCP3774142.1 GT4 family glycosyltransferase PelF [Paenibacillus sp. MZ04-78.2]